MGFLWLLVSRAAVPAFPAGLIIAPSAWCGVVTQLACGEAGVLENLVYLTRACDC